MHTNHEEQYFTPAELCERWKIDVRTLEKLALPWVWITPRVRRVAVEVVIIFEKRERFEVLSTASSSAQTLPDT